MEQPRTSPNGIVVNFPYIVVIIIIVVLGDRGRVPGLVKDRAAVTPCFTGRFALGKAAGVMVCSSILIEGMRRGGRYQCAGPRSGQRQGAQNRGGTAEEETGNPSWSPPKATLSTKKRTSILPLGCQQMVHPGLVV